MENKSSTEAVTLKIDAAMKMVGDLCKPKGTAGHRDWVMSIPAQPDYDPDLVISGALHDAKQRIRDLEAKFSPLTLPRPKRYDVVAVSLRPRNDGSGGAGLDYEPSEYGEWMDAEEAEAYMDQQDQRIRDLEAETDVEAGRWQSAIYALLLKHCGDSIDGGGCDSGDLLDFTLAEIEQGLRILTERAEAAEAENAKLRAEGEWVSVDDRLPLKFDNVIVHGGLAYWNGEEWTTMTGHDSGRVIQWKVTHWRPLPAPPVAYGGR